MGFSVIVSLHIMLLLLPLVMFGTVPGTEGWNTCQGQLATDVQGSFGSLSWFEFDKPQGIRRALQGCTSPSFGSMALVQHVARCEVQSFKESHVDKADKSRLQLSHSSTWFNSMKLGILTKLNMDTQQPNAWTQYILSLADSFHSYSPMTCFRCFGETLLKSFEIQRLTYLT